MDRVDDNWKEVDLEHSSDAAIVNFLRMNCTFSINVNAKDPRVVKWLYKNKHLIKTGKE